MSKKLKPTEIELAKSAQKYCDKHGKSTEFMIQYIQDFAGINFDKTLEYLTTYGGFSKTERGNK